MESAHVRIASETSSYVAQGFGIGRNLQTRTSDNVMPLLAQIPITCTQEQVCTFSNLACVLVVGKLIDELGNPFWIENAADTRDRTCCHNSAAGPITSLNCKPPPQELVCGKLGCTL